MPSAMLGAVRAGPSPADPRPTDLIWLSLGTVEVRPLVPCDEWLRVAREAGADVPDEAV
jgi:hypothetical protein